MKTEHLIITPAIRREQLRSAYSRVQYLCIGVGLSAAAGTVDTWWKSYHVAVLFLVIAMGVGAVKARVSRQRDSSPVPVIDITRVRAIAPRA